MSAAENQPFTVLSVVRDSLLHSLGRAGLPIPAPELCDAVSDEKLLLAVSSVQSSLLDAAPRHRRLTDEI